MSKILSKLAIPTLCVAALSFATLSAQAAAPIEVAAISPVVLQLDIKSTCTAKGAEFQISNNGAKWPRTAVLRLYTADNKSVVSKRKLRLALGQKVTFVVKKSKMRGHPVAVWIDPSWYKRTFKYDATINCS